ncbi:leucine-rich repeat-containing protein 15-like [Planococcus citri]|uniref:leucine-rich repeat-containing protein 15-like n=1 Tax=Planococcus citri TaxID=170843 RepID=UPI0031FA11B0
MLLSLFILLISAYEVKPFEPRQSITGCPKQCACNAEYMADLPLMKWLTIPMNKYWQQNDSIFENQVWDNNEEVQLQHNPLVHAAYCVYQQDAKYIDRNEFTPHIEALTILHGPDYLNRTIEHELSSFHELLALDIQGYQQPSTTYSEIFLNYNALLELQNLQYLNIQHVRLVPNPNSTSKDIPQAAYDYLQTILMKQTSSKSQNLTFIIPDEPEIVPYEEFKMKNDIISTFSHLTNLLFLRLYHCELESIKWEMFDGLQNLQTLSLESNNISRIPEFAFYGMPNLKILILSHNKLTSISTESLAGLFTLEHLDLTYNQLRHLSDYTFAPLPALFSLDIRHNPIVSIHSSTFEVMNMTKVLIIGNDNAALSIHRSAFNGLFELETLVITGVNISALEKSALRGMPSLKYLKFEGRVEYIYFDAFADSIQLETVVLKNCSLKYLSMDAFYGLVNLKTLDLSDNNLGNLPMGLFDGLNSLAELILTYNKLTTLPPNIFDSLVNIQMIRLDNNPWHCTCQLSTIPSHAVNRVKQTKMVEKCNYHYDKSPCTSQLEEYYAYSPKVVPKCATPERYSEWNLLHVVNKKLNCRKRVKHSKKENNSTSQSDQTDHNKDAIRREEESQPMKNAINSKKQKQIVHDDGMDNGLMLNANNAEKKLNEVQDF